MTQVAQAYIHTYDSQSDALLKEWGQIAEALSYETAKRVFPVDVEIIVSIEPGSTKTRVKVFLAGVITAYGAVATYPDFKQGLYEMVQDAREFAGAFNDKFIKTTRIPNADIVRKERRTETPGRLLRAVEGLEDLQNRLPLETQFEIEQELHGILGRLRVGLSDLEPGERESVVTAIEREHWPNLPPLLAPRLALRPPEYTFGNEQNPFLGQEGQNLLRIQQQEPPHGFLGHVRTDKPLDQQLRLIWQHNADD